MDPAGRCRGQRPLQRFRQFLRQPVFVLYRKAIAHLQSSFLRHRRRIAREVLLWRRRTHSGGTIRPRWFSRNLETALRLFPVTAHRGFPPTSRPTWRAISASWPSCPACRPSDWEAGHLGNQDRQLRNRFRLPPRHRPYRYFRTRTWSSSSRRISSKPSPSISAALATHLNSRMVLPLLP